MSAFFEEKAPIDWRKMSDEEIDAALVERERRNKQPIQPSPAPWTNNTFQVVDANGVEICHCGGTQAGWDGATPKPERAEANARHCAVGPDGVALAKMVIQGGASLHQSDPPLLRAAEALLKKAGVA